MEPKPRLLKRQLDQVARRNRSFSFPMQCQNCEATRDIDATIEEFLSIIDDGGVPCIESTLCADKMLPYKEVRIYGNERVSIGSC